MILRHIVLAVDFSPAGDRLQADLPKLRGWSCERLSPVHVLTSHYPQVPAEGHRLKDESFTKPTHCTASVTIRFHQR